MLVINIRQFNYAVVQLAPIMLYTISWKSYFVFMCFNFAFIPVVYFTFVETNRYSLEKLDAIFAEAYEKKENPVFTKRRIRKGRPLDVAKRNEAGEGDAEHKERRSGSGSDETSVGEGNVQAEKFDPEELEMTGAIGGRGRIHGGFFDARLHFIRSLPQDEPLFHPICCRSPLFHAFKFYCHFSAYETDYGHVLNLKNQTSDNKSLFRGCWNRSSTCYFAGTEQVAPQLLNLAIKPENFDCLLFLKSLFDTNSFAVLGYIKTISSACCRTRTREPF